MGVVRAEGLEPPKDVMPDGLQPSAVAAWLHTHVILVAGVGVEPTTRRASTCRSTGELHRPWWSRRESNPHSRARDVRSNPRRIHDSPIGWPGGSRTRSFPILSRARLPFRHGPLVSPGGVEPPPTGVDQPLKLACLPFHHGDIGKCGWS